MSDEYPFLDLLKDFDENKSLWLFSEDGVGGHTKAVVNLPRSHCGTTSFVRLLIAAQTDKLGELDVMKILQGVKQTQISSGQDAGEFLWYLEENHVEDNHATFFNGLAMCAIYGGHLEQFTKEERELIGDMLQATYPIFIRHVRHFNRHYPNEYLGDLVCAWLIGEWFGMPDEDRKMLLDEFVLLERLWHKNGWGWGEHLSDTYGCICLDELSLILLLAKQLTNEAKKSLQNLFSELLEIDDLFQGGPRVPAIRQYAFLIPPEGLHYRAMIKPVPKNAMLEHYTPAVGSRLPTCAVPLQTPTGDAMSVDNSPEVWLPMGATFYKLGWDKIATPKKKFSAGSYKIECINGQAQIYINESIRIGTTEQFPLIPQAEHLTYGLAWQSFPVSVWTPGKEWIYMQWETSERDKTYHQPAENKYTGKFNPAITQLTNPPIIGKTYSIAENDNFLILRVMPMIIRDWQRCVDRFRIVGKFIECSEIANTANWKQLQIKLSEHIIYLQCVQLSCPNEETLLKKQDSYHDWSLIYTQDKISNKRAIANLWGISFAQVTCEPEIEFQKEYMGPATEERLSAIVRWHWPKIDWQVRINLSDMNNTFYRIQ